MSIQTIKRPQHIDPAKDNVQLKSIRHHSKIIGLILSAFDLAFKDKDNGWLNKRSVIHYLQKNTTNLNEEEVTKVRALHDDSSAKEVKALFQKVKGTSSRSYKILTDAIHNYASTNLNQEEKPIFEKAFLDFYHHFAEYLVKYSQNKQLKVLTECRYDIFDLDNPKITKPDFFSKLHELTSPAKEVWEHWAQRPEEFVRSYHKWVNFGGSLVLPKNNLLLSQHEIDEKKISCHYFDDGIWFFETFFRDI